MPRQAKEEAARKHQMELEKQAAQACVVFFVQAHPSDFQQSEFHADDVIFNISNLIKIHELLLQ